ncbi:Uncharacterised protein [Mycobacteroides abscessus]|nr:Uncharacterised protein [Mycobacteroides abscessus]
MNSASSVSAPAIWNWPGLSGMPPRPHCRNPSVRAPVGAPPVQSRIAP